MTDYAELCADLQEIGSRYPMITWRAIKFIICFICGNLLYRAIYDRNIGQIVFYSIVCAVMVALDVIGELT